MLKNRYRAAVVLVLGRAMCLWLGRLARAHPFCGARPPEGSLLFHPHRSSTGPQMPPSAPKARGALECESSARLEMPPNAPWCPRMPPLFGSWQNEPTVGRAVDRGLRQLTPVDAGLPQHANAQNEPTAVWPNIRRAQRVNVVQRHATACNATQRDATCSVDLEKRTHRARGEARGETKRRSAL